MAIAADGMTGPEFFDGMIKMIDLQKELYLQCPYKDFPIENYKLDLQGWSDVHSWANSWIRELQPELIIEVGSWKGRSAITMAKIVKECGLKTKILCIDTWLGSVEHWNKINTEKQSWYDSLNHRNGYPQLYYQFLANVILQRCEDVIVPFPSTSTMAALWLAQKKITASLIYVDAGHGAEDVFRDACNYYNLLSKGGILFGDDWPWESVQKGVNAFVTEALASVKIFDKFWMVRK